MSRDRAALTEPLSDERAVSHIEVASAHAGQRIDNFLLRYLKTVPRSHVYRILRSGEVRVNRRRVRPAYRLESGDKLRLPPVRRVPPSAARVPAGLAARLEAAVLQETEEIVVLDKPAGLAVHGGSGLRFGIIEALRQARPRAPTLELVHRLDRETSGCLLIAKSHASLRELHALLRAGGIDKHYRALALGRWLGGTRAVEVALGRSPHAPGRMAVRADGKAAKTVFTPLRRFQEAALMAVQLTTGRKHQIRVHAAHIGHPLAGDDCYGDAVVDRGARELGLQRLFLHASRLRFRMPTSGREYCIDAPLPEDLARVIERLSSGADVSR